MIGQTRSMIFPLIAASPSSGLWFPKDHAQESIIDYVLRIRDELLWPRILVRSAPPPDEV